jgi:hypothetical protein
VPRLNLRVEEIRRWQLEHGFGAQSKKWGVRGAQARSKLLSNLRGAGCGARATRPTGQIESRVSRDSHMRYEGQGHCTENIRRHTVRFSVYSVEGVPAFSFS